MMGTEQKQPKDFVEEISRMWLTMSASEIAQELGIGKTSVYRWAKNLGLQHTPETIIRLRKKSACNKESYKKRHLDFKAIHEKRSRTRRMEELRVMSGLPQRTKFKIRMIPVKVYNVMWTLRKKYNYFFKTDSATLYYDSQTNRNPNEQYYIDRYGIKFEQVDDE